MSNVLYEVNGPVVTISINRPEVRNAANRVTGEDLADAFRRFDRDPDLKAAVLCGVGGTFCAGADLKSVAQGMHLHLETDMSKDGPMGPTRMRLSKPVIAAVSGYAVAGGLELACWCDLRVMEEDATFGVFCRRFGVPLIDGGSQRLPRLIGLSRALDMILTGRPVGAQEALSFGLANRVVPKGEARRAAEALALELTKFPSECMKNDRYNAYTGLNMPFDEAMAMEFRGGLQVIQSGETVSGAGRFSGGTGRHGDFKAL